MNKYQGTAGGCVVTHSKLLSLARNRKSVCAFNNSGKITTVLPAACLLHRPFGDVVEMLNCGIWYEYIKPAKPVTPRRYCKTKRLSVTEQRDIVINIAQYLISLYYAMPKIDPNSMYSVEEWNNFAKSMNEIRNLDLRLEDLIVNKQGELKSEPDQTRRTENPRT